VQAKPPSENGALGVERALRARSEHARSSRSTPAKAPSATRLGLYVHVPFCASTCDFCAFYQESPQRAELDRYLDGIAAELALASSGRPADTIFWGGGTPSVLPPRDIERLGSLLLEHLGAPPREWTVELAPSSVKADKLAVLRDLGVNRLSLGVQSFNEKTLAALGRRQSPPRIFPPTASHSRKTPRSG
jgi:oxygen-independent coproporphyrinogen-3 oxidase